MTKERIRILVDTSRDTGWSDGLIRIEPDNIYQTTKFIDWLGIDREETPQQKPSLTTDLQAIPDEIPIKEQVREDRKIRIFYTHFVEEQVDTCMEFAKKIGGGDAL